MTLKRPTTIAEMRCALDRFATSEGVRRGLAFKPAATDVFISPFAKCGTTWMQQIVHGLRSGGSMAFDEITEVIPWLELAHDIGADLNAPQVAHPRAFKSHLCWEDIPKGARYIVVLRDPLDAMMSLFRFFDGWFFKAGAISISEFAEYYLEREDESWWWHARSWWLQRERSDVLFLTYEGMQADLPGVVARVSTFTGVAADQCTLELVTRQASLDFMKAHGSKFDDHLVRQSRDTICGLPLGGQTSKVRDGKVGRGAAELPDEVRIRFDERWRTSMRAKLGLRSYSDLIVHLR